MKSTKIEYLIFAIAMVFIFYSGKLDQNTRLIITGVLIAIILINEVMKKRNKKEKVKKE